MNKPVISETAVRRFTTQYVVPEDRIRLSIEREDDSLLVLWLTRRLTSRLVQHLVKVIDALPRLKGETPQAPPSDNIQRRNQLDALGKIEQQAPVLAGSLPDGLETHLIIEVGLRLARTGALLDFKIGKDQVVQTLPFSEDALRQWVGVLHMNFRKAQWEEDVWPAWITAKGWNEGPDALRLN